jgi:carboxypeptidase D
MKTFFFFSLLVFSLSFSSSIARGPLHSSLPSGQFPLSKISVLRFMIVVFDFDYDLGFSDDPQNNCIVLFIYFAGIRNGSRISYSDSVRRQLFQDKPSKLRYFTISVSFLN